jgi:glyoxylase-like metal-dependent hydrolase (beta-lactamase superfamily II)
VAQRAAEADDRFGFSMFHMPRKRYRVRRYIPLDDDSVIDLGGNQIHVISAPGHTPGSCIFVDDAHRALFVGDAIGNGGASAWMWLPGSANTGAYRQTLRSLLTRLAPYETYTFLGGHRANTLPTAERPEGLPLNLQVVRDMATLCTMMLNHAARPSGRQRFFLLSTIQYAYGTAGMWTRKSKIR